MPQKFLQDSDGIDLDLRKPPVKFRGASAPRTNPTQTASSDHTRFSRQWRHPPPQRSDPNAPLRPSTPFSPGLRMVLTPDVSPAHLDSHSRGNVGPSRDPSFPNGSHSTHPFAVPRSLSEDSPQTPQGSHSRYLCAVPILFFPQTPLGPRPWFSPQSAMTAAKATVA